MSIVWSTKTDEILSVGRSLESLGVENWGLVRAAAVSALDAFERNGVSVLGGDVYVESGALIEPTYDSWYCDREPGEAQDHYVRRSIDRARLYIANYPSGESILFALVPGG